MNYAGGDYIEVLNGNGLDPRTMAIKATLCGMDSNGGLYFKIACICIKSIWHI